eukprot:CAMPEP_0174257916 /NCGR_PEP_ID=MMETSP0439-20130205/7014_1 /TAXON_ID=0 /ORGANISM="Stereomyxa ramosa, Strain Chinc5" /LENGTH=100 /DNA_ID=CAMNT_0015341223 /DNA_START=903 /DNA_END=1205 /DNA_ORIENTATION=-
MLQMRKTIKQGGIWGGMEVVVNHKGNQFLQHKKVRAIGSFKSPLERRNPKPTRSHSSQKRHFLMSSRRKGDFSFDTDVGIEGDQNEERERGGYGKVGQKF